MPFTPYDAATHAIGRARALLEASRPRTPGLSVNLRFDLRRLSLVMAVSALDAYMHRLVVQQAYEHGDLPAGLAKLDVPFERLLAQADETAKAARAQSSFPRPRVGVKRELRDRLLRETFQRYDDVSRALSMAGRSGGWDSIGKAMNLAPAEIRDRLNSIVHRRNQIVHEADYERLERPQHPYRNPISLADARSAVDFLEELVEAIHSV